MELREHNVELINTRAARNGQRLLMLLEGYPIVNIPFIADSLGISRSTARNLVNDFEQAGILSPRDTEKKRYRTFLYGQYLGILRQGGDPL